MKRFLAVIVVSLLLYAGSYVWLRLSRIQRWDRDGHDYVILPRSTAIYYFYRPLTYIDARTTGMRFHIGPHHQ